MNSQENNRTAFLFNEGSEYRAYRYFGCHQRDNGHVFRLWAPHALKVYVVGEFNSWSDSHPMSSVPGTGFWECFIPRNNGVEGSAYKYKIIGYRSEIYRADPFAFSFGVPPETASVVLTENSYRFRDGAWMERRSREYSALGARSLPINIYEMRLDSWQRRADGSYMSYREIGDSLAPYLLQMGYTHVQLLSPLACDGAGGCVGFYCPDQRFGNAAAFAEFVDIMHRAGIGVILEWDIKHFSLAEQGLSHFDGNCLYEKASDGEENGLFDLSKGSVQSFIISAIVFFASFFHVDGFSVKELPGAVFSRSGTLDRAACGFIKRLNGVMASYFPDVMMICDRDIPGIAVTSSTAGGLGFTFKWDEVCTKDTVAYSEVSLRKRERSTNEIASPLRHAFGEASVLTLSERDIFSQGESFLSKMPGDYGEKFAGNKVFFTYMMTRPGKKLRFMGSEIGQFDMPDKSSSVQWFLTDYETHARFQLYCAALNGIYLREKAFWEKDCSPFGFSLDLAHGGILAYRRFDNDGGEIAVILNFTPYRIRSHQVGVSKNGSYSQLLSSDSVCFGGEGIENSGVVSHPSKEGKLPYTLDIDLPPLGAVILKYNKNI